MLLKALTLGALLSCSQAFAAGTVTFVKGEFTSLKLDRKGEEPQPLKKNDKVVPGHSYSTTPFSHAVMQLPDGAWVRIGTDTKFELLSDADHYTIHLRTGTLRVLYAANLQKGKTNKLVVKTDDAWVDTSSAKYTVTYIPLFEHTSVYVDKGLVQLSPIDVHTNKVPQMIHGGEFSELVRSELNPRPTKEMSEKEQRMLKTLLLAQLKKTEE